MSPTTVSQRVAQFLGDHRRYGAYCDKCIAKELRLGAGKNRTMARNVTSVLAEMDEFRLGPGICCKCGEHRLVTHRRLSGSRRSESE